LGFTVVRPIEKVFFTLNSFVKTSSNKFMPGNVKIAQQNYCELSDRKSINTKFAFNIMDKLNPDFDACAIRPCPLKVKL
jgi:hypothetical protein